VLQHVRVRQRRRELRHLASIFRLVDFSQFERQRLKFCEVKERERNRVSRKIIHVKKQKTSSIVAFARESAQKREREGKTRATFSAIIARAHIWKNLKTQTSKTCNRSFSGAFFRHSWSNLFPKCSASDASFALDILLFAYSQKENKHTRKAGGFYITYMCMRVNFEFKFKNFFLLEKTIFEKQKRSIKSRRNRDISRLLLLLSATCASRAVVVRALLNIYVCLYIYIRKRACCACVFENSEVCCVTACCAFWKTREKKNGENPKQQIRIREKSNEELHNREEEEERGERERETCTAPRHIYRDRETEEEEREEKNILS